MDPVMEPAIRKTIARALLAGHAPQTLAAQFKVPLADVLNLVPAAPAPEPEAPEPETPPPFTPEMENGNRLDELAVMADRMLKARDHVTSKVVDGEGVLTEDWKAWRKLLRRIRKREIPPDELGDSLPPEPPQWV